MELSPGQSLAQYRLVGKIGEGGMGVIWKALDTELNRHVALKILPPELTSDEERRLRFRREAQAAAALSHPNIAVIYQVGEHRGSPFIAMELVKGTSLRDRLASGPMAARDWAGIALQVVEGLAHAHRNGVVHRDLKPDNIMITAEGQVKILDFGLAKLLLPEGSGEARTPGEAGAGDTESKLQTISRELTRAGKVFGTVAYMSPEQARGEAVDHRSDLFSLGVLLYEAACGRLPFKARSDVETLSAVIAVDPRPLGEIAPGTNPEVERIVRKAMEKEPGDRYQNAADLAVDLRNLKRDLESGRAPMPSGPARGAGEGPARHHPPTMMSGSRWLLAASLLALVGAVAVYYARHRQEAPAVSGAPRSVAILPFETGAGDEDAAYLGDGIAESVINGLSGIHGLRVVPRSVVFGYRGKPVDPRAAGEELGVAAVVTGRVSRRGDTLTVAAELVDVDSVSQIWGDRYSRTSTDILDVQEEITREIARNLGVDLTAEEDRALARRPTDNPGAYDAYLKGQALAEYYTEDELEAARGYFEKALEIDPGYALALAGLSTVESQLHRNVQADPARLRRAVEYAQKALEIDPGLARAHAALGELLAVQYRYRDAIPKFEEAIRLEPQEPSYHDNLSWVLTYIIPPEAERAEAEAREAIRLAPTFAFAYYHLGRALLAQGEIEEARKAFVYGAELGKSQDTMALGLGMVAMAEGDYEKARALFAKHPADTPLHRVYLASSLAALGEREEAMRLLEESAEGGYGDAPFLETSEWFDSLRGDPRFTAVLESVRETLER